MLYKKISAIKELILDKKYQNAAQLINTRAFKNIAYNNIAVKKYTTLLSGLKEEFRWPTIDQLIDINPHNAAILMEYMSTVNREVYLNICKNLIKHDLIYQYLNLVIYHLKNNTNYTASEHISRSHNMYIEMTSLLDKVKENHNIHKYLNSHNQKQSGKYFLDVLIDCLYNKNKY